MKYFCDPQVRFEPADERNFVGRAQVKRMRMLEENQQTVNVFLVAGLFKNGVSRSGRFQPATPSPSTLTKSIGMARVQGPEWRTSP